VITWDEDYAKWKEDYAEQVIPNRLKINWVRATVVTFVLAALWTIVVLSLLGAKHLLLCP
jgi:hypothetical protein